MKQARQNATQSLSDVTIIRTNGRNNLIDSSVWKAREESRKYRQLRGNYTDYGSSQLADASGCKVEDIYRAEYGLGKLHIVLYLRNGGQKSFPIETLFPILEPMAKGSQGLDITDRYVISATQEIKEY